MTGLRPPTSVIALGIPLESGVPIGAAIDEVTGLLVEDGLSSDSISQNGDGVYIQPGEEAKGYPDWNGDVADETVVTRYTLDPQTYEAPPDFVRGLMIAFKEGGPADGITVELAVAVIRGALAMLAPVQNGPTAVVDFMKARRRRRPLNTEGEIRTMERELGVTKELSGSGSIIANIMAGRWQMSDVREMYDRLRTTEAGRKFLRRWMTAAVIPSPADLLIFLRTAGERILDDFDDLDEMSVVTKFAEDGAVSMDVVRQTLSAAARHIGTGRRRTETFQFSPGNLTRYQDVPSIENPVFNLPGVLDAAIQRVRQRHSGDPNIVIGLSPDIEVAAGGLPKTLVTSLWDAILDREFSGWVAVIHRGRLLINALFDLGGWYANQSVAVRIALARRVLGKTIEGRAFIGEIETLFGAARDTETVREGGETGEMTKADFGNMLPLLEAAGNDYDRARLRHFFGIAAMVNRDGPPVEAVDTVLTSIARHIRDTGKYPAGRFFTLESARQRGARLIRRIQITIEEEGNKDVVISLPKREITDLSPEDAAQAVAGVKRHGRIWIVSNGEIILDAPATLGIAK